MLERAEMARYLPHAGRMRLLDRVLAWDVRKISCSALTHRDADNPLRGTQGLAVWAGVEYAAQAAALHGALSRNEATPRSGVLAALKNVEASCAWLHDIDVPLGVTATLMHADPAGAIYTFSLSADKRTVLDGQFTLMFIDDEVHA